MLAWRLLRSAALGAAIGLALAVLLERTSEGADWPLTVAGVALLMVGMAVRRWLLFRREAPRREGDEKPDR